MELPDTPHFRIDKADPTCGFATDSGKKGDRVEVLTLAALTSDDDAFHKFALRLHNAYVACRYPYVNSVYQFLVLVHDDSSADVYLNNLPMIMDAMPKRSLKAGEPVRSNDIGDIRRVRFEGITIEPTDRVACCIRVDWRFGLYFDFTREGDRSYMLDANRLELGLGALMRRLRFATFYDLLSDRATYERMSRDGWFPFVEIIGDDFEDLAALYKRVADDEAFDLGFWTADFTRRFDRARMTRILDRWWTHPIFAAKRPIIEAAIEEFLSDTQRGNINCIKTLMSEIDGVLRLSCFEASGKKRIRFSELFDHVEAQALAKEVPTDSTLLPHEFRSYLDNTVFREFTLPNDGEAITRHTALHGVADADAYTRESALQSILILDQIRFYLPANVPSSTSGND